jgi:archaetidylinositol phosphate synthase
MFTLDDYRPYAEKKLAPLAKRCKNIHPNLITWTSLVFAGAAGYVFYTGYLFMLPLAAALVFLSSFFDAFDGALARYSKKASKRGDFLDHVLDRYADIFILGGIMLSPYCRNFTGLLAIIGVLLTSYMGTQAQALVGKRDYKGLAGRANRLLLLIFVPLIHFILEISNVGMPYGIGLIEWMMIYFAVVGNINAITRATDTWKALK